jgi:integrase
MTQGQNPFITKKNKLDEIFKDRVERQRLSGEWSENTISNYELFYEKVLKKPLGHKNLNKIKYGDLVPILENKNFFTKNSVWKNRLRQILNPIFKEAIKNGTIFVNPCDKLEHFTVQISEKISSKIVDDNLLFLSRELYRCVNYYPCKTISNRPQYMCFLYLVILSARRIGELCQITKEDCYLYHKKIISPVKIVKGKTESSFPIPDECLKYIESVKTGKLFPSIERGSVYLMFQRLIKLSNIELRKGKILTVHNTRDLFLNIVIENGVDSLIADYCLDHVVQGTMKHYESFSYKQKKETFEMYWSLIRNDELQIKKEKFKKEFFKNFEEQFEKAWLEKIKE